MLSPREGDKKLQWKFFSRAKTLLDRERGRPHVVTLQALFIMFVFLASSGQDRIGRQYLYQATDMYRRLKLDVAHTRPAACAKTTAARREWRATTTTMWGCWVLER